MKLPKLPKFELPKKMLYNQMVLYALVVVALLQMVFYVQNQDPSSIIIMVLIGFLASFFSKNMIVILTITIVFSAIISMKIPREEREGFENDEKNKKLSAKEKAKLNKKKEKEEIIEKDEDTTQEVEEALKLLRSEYPEFLEAQNDILEKIKEIDPILERAENFANKFEEYSKKTM